MDRTVTAFGRRLLRQWVSQPLVHAPAIRRRLDAVEELMAATGPGGVADTVSGLLRQTPDLERGITAIFYRKCTTAEFHAVASALESVRQTLEPMEASQALQSELLSGLLAVRCANRHARTESSRWSGPVLRCCSPLLTRHAPGARRRRWWGTWAAWMRTWTRLTPTRPRPRTRSTCLSTTRETPPWRRARPTSRRPKVRVRWRGEARWDGPR